MRTKWWMNVLLIALLAAAATSGPATAEDQPAEHKPPLAAEKLEPYECGSVTRLHTLGGVFLASQPAAEDFKMAQAGGIKTVINLRKPSETDWNEQEFIKELGLDYHNVPFQTPDELTDEVFDEVRGLLAQDESKPILLHCSSANRVGAVWLAHRVLDGGLSYEDALAEAKTVGLKLPAYETKAKDYIESQQSK